MRNPLRAIAVIAAWSFAPGTAMADCSVAKLIDMPVTMEGLRASVPVKINGRPTRFWLDSGAFFSIMPKAKAAELGLATTAAPPGFLVVGVGGQASVEVATIKKFEVEGQMIPNLQFLVGGTDVGNGLIGLNILALADSEFDLAHGSVRLFRTKGCNKRALAYWAKDLPWFDAKLVSASNSGNRHFNVEVLVNGKKLIATIDSGAPTSVITRRGAKSAGIDLAGVGVQNTGMNGGIGRKLRQTWIVRIKQFEIGGETIQNPRLYVVDDTFDVSSVTVDMLLGADFLLAHRMFISPTQGTIYFTYNGGAVFSVGQSGNEKTTTTLEVAAAAKPSENAADFARTGAAHITRREYADALADLTKAIALAPDNARYHFDRAKAYFLRGGFDAASKAEPGKTGLELGMADLDRAVALAPSDPEILEVRADRRLAKGDKVGALADLEAAAKFVPSGSLLAAELVTHFERLGRADRMVALLDPVIALHAQDASLSGLLNSRCWARGLQNAELNLALADCEKALKRGGPNMAIIDSRALVRYRRQEFALALADYNQVLATSPSSAASLYMRGLTHIAMGERAKGALDLDAARKLDANIQDRFEPYGLTP